MTTSFVIFGILSVIVLGYYFLKRKYDYWADRNIPFVKPKFLQGNMAGVGTETSIVERMRECYNELKGKAPVGGIFLFTEPVALIVDLELLRHVFVKDFQHFHDRGVYVNERDDPLSAHLFSLPGTQWKNLRMKLSPTFTSGKMKMMHPTILGVADKFLDHLVSITGTENQTEVEFKELLAQFTTDVIGNTAFGVECNTMNNPNSEFRRIGRKILESTPTRVMKDVFVTMFPNVSKKLRLKTTAPEATTFIMNMLADTIKYREENKVQRNDFLSLLLQLKNTGRLEGEDTEFGKMTFNEMAAQVFIFYVAGFETSSSTMSFALYELALNQEVQQRAREEISEVLERNGGEMTYEAAMDLKYIDQIINETLRKYPVADPLIRKTTIPYQVPNSNIYLEKDTIVLIPAMGFHYDPEIFPNPDNFDPDRFSKENIAKGHLAWMPFGHGPRNCIGLRFGMMQTRLGIATVLKNFFVTPSQNTPVPLKIDPSGQLLSPKGGLYLNLKPIENKIG